MKESLPGKPTKLFSGVAVPVLQVGKKNMGFYKEA